MKKKIASQQEEFEAIAAKNRKTLETPVNRSAGANSKGDLAVMKSDKLREVLGDSDETVVRVLGHQRDGLSGDTLTVEIYNGPKKGQNVTVRLHDNEVGDWVPGIQNDRAQGLISQGDRQVKEVLKREVADALDKGGMNLTEFDEWQSAITTNLRSVPGDRSKSVLISFAKSNSQLVKSKEKISLLEIKPDGTRLWRGSDITMSNGEKKPGKIFHTDPGSNSFYEHTFDEYKNPIRQFYNIEKIEIPRR